MPVNFLTPEQREKYGCFNATPSPAQLARYFHLDDIDRQLILRQRTDHTRLGYVLQLCTVRFLGTFLSNPVDVPEECIRYLATQLNIEDVSELWRYSNREATRREHAGEIQSIYGYRDFAAQPAHFQLTRWLYTRAWLAAERPIVLFDLATAWLAQHKILLPGATILEREIAPIHERANHRLWRMLNALPNAQQRDNLLQLLQVAEGQRFSYLEILRRAPTRISSRALLQAVERLRDVRALGVDTIELSTIPASRIKSLAQYASTAWARTIEAMRPDRRLATLLAFAHRLAATAQDDVLDVFDQAMVEAIHTAQRNGQQARLQALAEQDQATLLLREACVLLLETEEPDIRQHIFSQIPPDQLAQAVEVTGKLVRPHDPDYHQYLLDAYRSFRQFIPALLSEVRFDGIASAQPVLEALAFLRNLDQLKPPPPLEEAPRQVVTASWRAFVFNPPGRVHRGYYTVCALNQLRENLRRRDIFVTPSERWADPRVRLLQGQAWEAVRSQVSRTLGLSLDPETEIHQLGQQLDEAYHYTAQNLAHNTVVRIENEDGRDRLVVPDLDKLDEPDSLVEARQQINQLLPIIDLSDVMLEIHRRTGFADAFTHISEGESRIEELPVSICAALLAEACNIPLEPLIDSNNPALTYGRLLWVKQNYLRTETLLEANALLVEAQAHIPLAQVWGGGEVASADGLRFVVPVQSVHSSPNRKYFGSGRGITLFNFMSDQFTGFHHIVIPGTVRDSLYILDGLLEHQTSLQPVEIMTDTASYTDIVFGLFWLLGFQFSPRLADIGGMRFWRINSKAHYGALDGIARNRVNVHLIAQHWEDLLRVAGSLRLGVVSASELMRTLQFNQRISTLGKAIGELGRVAKTLYLLPYIDDESYRRRVLTQLTRTEGRHRLMRAIFHGRRGQVRQRYRRDQEEQLSALGLVANIIILWNTLYIDATVHHLNGQGLHISDQDLARIPPLGFEHINMLGRYHFDPSRLPEPDSLRPLRDPAQFHLPVDWGF